MPDLNDLLESSGFRDAESLTEGTNLALLPAERELFRELVQGLRTIRYGSIVLTVHDGRLVEINKTVRIRSRARPKE